jgi:hypothetical protein
MRFLSWRAHAICVIESIATVNIASTLPFIPKFREDELLGSWFARVAEANQPATWRWVLRQCGYGVKGQPPHDIAGRDEKYEKLISTLGRSYPSMLKTTTLPFWLFFEASDTEVMYDEEIRIPARDIAGCGAPSGARSYSKMRRLKYCPCCIREQLESGAGTYWRRSHQLKASVVCVDHKVQLRASCYECGKIYEIPKQANLKLPEAICTCGADLTAKFETDARLGKRFHALSSMVRDTLEADLPNWRRQHVVALAQSIISERWGGSRIKAFDAMEERFGLERYARAGLRLSGAGVDPAIPVLTLEDSVPSWSASTFAAFFVTSGLQFEDLRQRLTECPSAPSDKPRRHSSRRFGIGLDASESVAAAKSLLMLKFQESGDIAKLIKMKRPFWLIYFTDGPWMRDLVGAPFDKMRIPSIDSDRSDLTKAMDTQDRHVLSYSPALARAQVRDAEWCEKHIAKVPPRIKSKAALLDYGQLHAALQRMLAGQSLPSRIAVRELALHCGTTEVIVRRSILECPAFEAEVARWNEGYPKDRVRWKLRELVIAQQTMTLARLLGEVSLNTTRKNLQMASEVFKEQEAWVSAVIPTPASDQ